MKSIHDYHLTCACGHHRILRSEDIPDAWLDEKGYNLLGNVFDRMVCLTCQRVGRPNEVHVHPVRNRPGMSNELCAQMLPRWPHPPTTGR